MQSATTLSSNQGPPAINAAELSVLLVEDSLVVRRRLAELLTEPGVMRVTSTAESEVQACELISANQYDAMVIDVELRPGSGITVVRHARARWVGLQRPTIIVLTNFSLPTVRDRCLAAGADHFLDKMRQFDQVYPLILAHNN